MDPYNQSRLHQMSLQPARLRKLSVEELEAIARLYQLPKEDREAIEPVLLPAVGAPLPTYHQVLFV